MNLGRVLIVESDDYRANLYEQTIGSDMTIRVRSAAQAMVVLRSTPDIDSVCLHGMALPVSEALVWLREFSRTEQPLRRVG